ncbi:MAG: C25 family cysteine peptidase, partial [Bacteroidota bacterium]|nr:C25 family cysteine peptidase [Bacteroidota bacterium]
ICPFKYNPATNQLIVLNNMKIDISFENADAALTSAQKNAKYSPVFESTFKQLLNYQPPAAKDDLTNYPIKYVIVADGTFESTLQPFIDWKTKSGYEVVEAYTGGDVTNNTTSIYNFLEPIYNSSNPMSYVLFVGDHSNLTCYDGNEGSHVTDLYYCDYTSDGIPDVYYGRMSAESITELQNIMDKIIPYEKYTIPNGSYLNECLFVAGCDPTYAPSHGDGQIFYGINEYYNETHDYTDIYGYYYSLSSGPYHVMSSNDAGASNDIISKISNGVGFANYTAHCDYTGWADPGFNNSDISSLANANEYPLMIGNCCLSNQFDQEDAFSEQILYAANKGAIGYIGGTNSTYWNEDFYWGVGIPSLGITQANANQHTYSNTDLGAYDGIWHENGEAYSDWHYTARQIIHMGNLSVTASGSSLTDYYWEIYQLMGDPSMLPYSTEPEALTISYTDPAIGATSLTVTTESYTYVAISQDGVLLDAKWSGSGTSVNLSFSALTGDPASIVATKQDKIPHIYDFTPISPDPPVANFSGTPTTILEGESVSFTDLSDYAAEWNWDFGDGGSSTEQDPVYTYTTAGTYTVSLTVTNTQGTDTETKVDYITVNVNTNPPVADFTADQTNINVGGTVNFTDLSTNSPTSWNWTFNGGDPGASTVENPSVTYNLPGTYTVELTATNNYGSDTQTKVGYITVTAAGFSMDFEDCANYSADFSPWSVYDGDGIATYGSSDCDFPGESDTMSFMAFNPTDAGFNLADAHGGVRVGMSICPDDGSESDDWLISNQLSLGDNSSFTLWALSPKPSTWGNDSYEVLVSTATNDPADFTNNISGGLVEAPASWTEHTYNL